jgi:hypothetical protein
VPRKCLAGLLKGSIGVAVAKVSYNNAKLPQSVRHEAGMALTHLAQGYRLEDFYDSHSSKERFDDGLNLTGYDFVLELIRRIRVTHSEIQDLFRRAGEVFLPYKPYGGRGSSNRIYVFGQYRSRNETSFDDGLNLTGYDFVLELIRRIRVTHSEIQDMGDGLVARAVLAKYVDSVR